MRAINSSELTYALTCGNGFYAPKLTTLGIAPPASTEAFITPSLASADSVIHSGYLVQLSAQPHAGAPQTCNGLACRRSRSRVQGVRRSEFARQRSILRDQRRGVIYEDIASMFAAIPEVGDPPAGHPLR